MTNKENMWLPMHHLMIASFAGSMLTYYIIPQCASMFLKAQISGADLGKKDRTRKIPEGQGVVSGCIFLMVTFVMIPVWYISLKDKEPFPHAQFVHLLAGLLSITCMLLLGFADDVLDLRWRHKLLFPTIASLPMLLVYYVTTNRTDIVVPQFLRSILGTNIDLGILYYIYMGMLAIFCTNAINILAGINGLEVGQSVIIAVSIMIFNIGEMNGFLGAYHRFSLFFLCPYVATSLPLLWYNWYPSQVFPGDTFCYFSGMTLAVVAILGHFSKTLLLFFLPQVINFLYSLPQLFHQIPCPRHRLPKYNETTDLRELSTVEFKEKDMKIIGRFALSLFKMFGLVQVSEIDKEGDKYIICNNLTLINFILKIFGPLHERTLTIVILSFQIICSLIGFFIRYPLAMLFYGKVVA